MLRSTGVKELRDRVDTLITIPNDRLLSVVEKRATLRDAFKVADDVVRQGVQGISDIITIPGMINVDFADVKTIMENQGTALMGIGQATGEQKAVHAAEMACASPLLETTIDGARGVLINITGGPDLTLTEVYEAADIIYKACDAENVNVIFGTVIDESLANEVRITVLATGFDGADEAGSADPGKGRGGDRRGVRAEAVGVDGGPDPDHVPESPNWTSRHFCGEDSYSRIAETRKFFGVAEGREECWLSLTSATLCIQRLRDSLGRKSMFDTEKWGYFWDTHAETAMLAAVKIVVIVVGYLGVRFLLARIMRGVLHSGLAKLSGEVLKARKARVRALQSVLSSTVGFVLGFVAMV